MTSQAPAPSWSVDRRFGFVSLLLALAVGALGWWLGTFHELGTYGVETDYYYQFWPAAQAILNGEPVANPRSGPGYPLLLAASGRLLPELDLFVFGKYVAAAVVALSGWCTFLCVRCFTSAGAALVAQALLYALLFRYSVVVSNDMLFVALASAALVFLLRRPQPGAFALLLAGAFAGLATTVRYPGVTLIATAAGWLLLWPEAGTAFGRRLRNLLLFLLPAVLCSAPSWAGQRLGLTDKEDSQTHALVAAEVYLAPSDRLSTPHVKEIEARFTSWSDLLQDWRKVVAHFFPQGYYDDANLILKDCVTLPAYLFLGAGLLLWFAGGWADRRRAFTFVLYPVLMFAVVALVPYQARYGYPLVPAACALAAAALCHRWGADGGAEETALARRVRLLLGAVVFVVPLFATVVRTREYLTTEPVELFDAAAALQPMVKEGDLLVARKPHLSHLARLGWDEPRPGVDLAEFLRWAREDAKARFLLVGPNEVQTNGALAPLQRGEAPPDLQLVWQHDPTRQRLYEIK